MRLWPWPVTRIVLAALLAWAVSGGVAGADPPARKPKPIRDKTLVAWVYVANLTQRGGSALTLENPGAVFDAIVFGELARGKWMVGSNVFSRTQRQQSRYPAEKADPKTRVQIAVVYNGKQVTLYRNGLKYADYRMGPEPVVFSTDSVVVMGLRHLDARGVRFFAGSIDDARVYDLALDAKTIASLRPNEPSDPKPLGWWNFEDGKAEDLMKTFPAGKLVGGAKIADGCLHLDGRSGLMVVGATVRSAGTAIVGAPGRDAIGRMVGDARALRERFLNDPYRPGYHFVSPEGRCAPFDPNAAIFWKGRYHHNLGCRYYIGTYAKDRFTPERHGRMTWADNAFFAPEALVDAGGRRIMWSWIFDQRRAGTRNDSGWSGTMSLPRTLWLGEDRTLRLRPVEELNQLRYNEQTVENIAVEADKEVLIEEITGNTIELMVEIDPQGAGQCGVKVCKSPDGAEQTLVYYDAADKKLKIDVTRASLGEGPKNIEAGPFQLKPGETLTLRVFVDKSVVEAFANDRQAVVRRIYPTRADSAGVSLFSRGGAAKVRGVKAWEMMPSNPY